MPPTSIASLPLELLLEIISYLPPSSLISFKLASKQTYQCTPAPPSNWLRTATDCQRLAFHRATHERKDLHGGRRRCVHCGIIAPAHRFLFPNPDSHLGGGGGGGGAPLCKWHQARFMSTSIPSHMESSLRVRLMLLTHECEEAVWVRVRRTYCAHERETVGWHVAKCTCECDSCGHFEVQCLVRVSPSASAAGGGVDVPQISEPIADGEFVREEHWQATQAAATTARPAWHAYVYPREIRGQPLVAYRKLVPVMQLQS